MIYLTKMGEVAQNGPWISLTEGTAGATTAGVTPLIVIPPALKLSVKGTQRRFLPMSVRNLLSRSLPFAPRLRTPVHYITGVGWTRASKTAVWIWPERLTCTKMR
jgi:hypothetical protein